MKIKGIDYLYILAAGYGVVLVLFAYFTQTSMQERDDISMIISVVMLVLAAGVYWDAGTRLNSVRKLGENLQAATQKIAKDHEEKGVMLWNVYKELGPGYLFEESTPDKEYAAYIMEMDRLEFFSKEGFKCQIDNYINKELIDKTAGKSSLNLIPGAMTGLGLLGTFVGLALGLQNFNTGSSAEIANSIAPLMSGIKVAFHTSIFGMILSLVFNFVYKGILCEAYDSVEDFIKHFGWYVCPNPENDYYNQMLIAIPNRIGQQMASFMQPQFEKMTETLADFSEHMLDNQVRGVGKIVDVFLSEMNKSLGKNFDELREILEKTCGIQKDSIEYMQAVLKKVGTMTVDIQSIYELSGKTIKTLSTYVEDVESLQTVINDSYMSVQLQLEENKKQEEKMYHYMDMLVKYEKSIKEATNRQASDTQKLLTLFSKLENDLTVSLKENMDSMNKQSKEIIQNVSQIAQEQMSELKDMTFSGMDALRTHAVENNRSLAQTAKEQMQEISTVAQTTTDHMSKVSQTLSDISEQFGGKVTSSLEKTFYVLDSELEKITRRLSDTIAEVDSNTARVPQIVAEAYEGMREVLKEMYKNMENYVKTGSQMQEKLMDLIEQLNIGSNEESED